MTNGFPSDITNTNYPISINQLDCPLLFYSYFSNLSSWNTIAPGSITILAEITGGLDR